MRVRRVACKFWGWCPTMLRKLERRFRAAVGRSIAEESIRLRVNRAKRRLVETDEDIKMVAAATGFCSVNHFGKVFARTVGTSPVRFRDARRVKSAGQARGASVRSKTRD